MTNGSGYYIIDAFTCGRGGTGRRARLRILWLTPCRFNSCRPHQIYGMLHKTRQYPVYFLLSWIIILRFSRFLPRLVRILVRTFGDRRGGKIPVFSREISGFERCDFTYRCRRKRKPSDVYRAAFAICGSGQKSNTTFCICSHMNLSGKCV